MMTVSSYSCAMHALRTREKEESARDEQRMDRAANFSGELTATRSLVLYASHDEWR